MPGLRRLVLLAIPLLALARPLPAQTPAGTDAIGRLLGRVERALQSGIPSEYLDLLSQSADRPRAVEFVTRMLATGITRIVIRERDRADLPGTLPGEGHQLLLEVLVETGTRARLATWQLDVRRRRGVAAGSADEWAVADQLQVSTLEGLHRLSLNPARQYTVKDLVVTSEDLRITLESGSVFVAESDLGPAAFVLVGRGEMTFSPSPPTERAQVRLFADTDVIQSGFDVAFLRVHPYEIQEHLDRGALVERPVDPREFRRAEEVFRQELPKSFSLDLGELSSETWSLLPGNGDFLAEVRTRRFDAVTYARSSGEVEDISFYQRRDRRNLAVYSSKEHLQRYTRFYDEDEESSYAVTHYDVDVSFDPARRFVRGRVRLDILVRADGGLNSVTLRLAESLNIHSITSPDQGRLLFLRIRGQTGVVLDLPGTLVRGTRLALTVDYSGPIRPQPIDREALWFAGQDQIRDDVEMPLEESHLFSNRSYWYPQASVSGYATAQINVTVPAGFVCVASGDPLGPVGVPPLVPGGGPARRFGFVATQPIRYLSLLVSPLRDVRSGKLRVNTTAGAATRLGRPPGVFYDDILLVTKANPRLAARARDIARTGQDILTFYSSLVGDFPYPSLSLAVVERRLPAGHSPPYMVVLALPAIPSNLSYQDDPASFPDFPEFFLAHELAHEWWGQAVGWKNYHEQWLSEGFAQYFAALYAERARGRAVFEGMIRRMRRWGVEESDQGAVFLGYRVGHVKGDSRLFRAIVYNKSAAVLHMLRRLVGDDAFFAGIRRFYDGWRFRKAGSDDLRRAMEAEAGVSLERFFERWIYGQDLPQVTFTWKVVAGPSGPEAVLRFEQTGEIFDMPATVTLDYVDRAPTEITVKVTDAVVEARVPVTGTLRKIDVNRDELTVAVFR